MHFEDFYMDDYYMEEECHDCGGYRYIQMPDTQPVMPPRGGMPRRPLNPSNPDTPGISPVLADQGYIQGYLTTIIGRYVKVEFILGTNMLIDREGTLVSVGIDHIVLREPETDDLVVADLYSIKFVKVYY